MDGPEGGGETPSSSLLFPGTRREAHVLSLHCVFIAVDARWCLLSTYLFVPSILCGFPLRCLNAATVFPPQRIEEKLREMHRNAASYNCAGVKAELADARIVHGDYEPPACPRPRRPEAAAPEFLFPLSCKHRCSSCVFLCYSSYTLYVCWVLEKLRALCVSAYNASQCCIY